ADALEAAGVRVWLDRRGIPAGVSWDATIVRAIRDCRVFLVLCTERAMRSSNVQQEIRLALEERRPLLPLLAERITFPDEVRYALAGLQWVELLDRPLDEWLTQLLEALARLGLRGDDRQRPETGSDGREPAPPTAIAVETGNSSPTGAPPPAVLPPSPPAPLTSFVGREQELA